MRLCGTVGLKPQWLERDIVSKNIKLYVIASSQVMWNVNYRMRKSINDDRASCFADTAIVYVNVPAELIAS